MITAKSPRGRPKIPWDPFDTELLRRIKSGEAEPNVEAESRYLEKWARQQGITSPSGGYLGSAQIRQRIKKRMGGADGYTRRSIDIRSLAARYALTTFDVPPA